MPTNPRPPFALPAVKPLVLALVLGWAGVPAWAQTAPFQAKGTVDASKLDEANKKILKANEDVIKEQAKAKVADLAASQALARATQAEQSAAEAKAKVQAQAGKATPEQFAALRKERDKATADADLLRAELEQANQNLKRAQAAATKQANATAELAAATADLTKLRRDSAAQQSTITALRAELEANKARANAVAAARPLAAEPPPVAAVKPATQAAPTPLDAPTAARASAGVLADLSELKVPNCNDACPSFVLLPNPGPVTLGTGSDASRVNFAHRFAMANTETTVGQYQAFIIDSGYQPAKTSDTYCNWNDKERVSHDRLPVSCVNVTDAEAYATWFAKKYAGQLAAGPLVVRVESMGLPSELEFEFAARAGRYTQAYLWADNASDAEICRHAQTVKCPGGAKTVGGRLPNDYKLYDMIGNVWEWTASPWRDARGALPVNGREVAAGVSGPRSVRGASFSGVVGGLGLSYRGRGTPGVRNDYVGFRLVARIAP